MMRHAGLPQGGEAPAGRAHLAMHASRRAGGTLLLASDPMRPGPPPGASVVSLSGGVDDVERARRAFGRPARGGEVPMPFAPTFWSPGSGRCRGRFGADWMIGMDTPEGATAMPA